MPTYKVLSELGRGGFGVVYRTLQVDLRREVAMKVLHDETETPKRRMRFEREIEACIALSHPNIIKVFDYGDYKGKLYYTMELLEGTALVDLVDDRKPLVPRRLVRLLVQMADALGFVHSKGMIHRDIKPHNIFLRKNGDGVLMDFGLMRDDSKSTLTEAGTLVGTPRFVAPEMILEKEVAAPADVYSLGVALWEAATARHAFEDRGPELKGLLTRIVKGGLPHVTETQPDFPVELDALLQRMIALDPAKRPTAKTVWSEARAMLEREDPLELASIDSLPNFFLHGIQEVEPDPLADTKVRAGKKDVRFTGTVRLTTKVPAGAAMGSGSGESSRRSRRRMAFTAGGLLGLALMGVWLGLRRAPEGPGPSVAPVTPVKLEAQPYHLNAFQVVPTGATGTLRLRVEAEGQAPREVEPGSHGRFVVRDVQPLVEYRLTALQGGAPVPGGPLTYKHPRLIPHAFYDLMAGEDYARLSLQTWEPHRFRTSIEEVETGSVVAEHETTEPARRYWHVYEGLKRNRNYILHRTLLEPDQILAGPSLRLLTRDAKFRKDVAIAIDKLNQPIIFYVGAGDLSLYEDYRSSTTIAEVVKSEFMQSPDTFDAYRALVNTVGEIGNPTGRPILKQQVEKSASPEHAYQAIFGYSKYAPEEDYDLIVSKVQKYFREGAWQPWKHNSYCADALVQTNGMRAHDDAMKIASDPAASTLGERIVACLILAEGLKDSAAKGLASLATKDPEARARRLALGHLPRRGDRGRDELRRILDEARDPDTLTLALMGLGACGDEEDVGRLESFLHVRGSRGERMAAVLGLGLLGRPGAAKSLAEYLARPGEDLVPFLMWALGEIGPAAKTALPALLEWTSRPASTRGMLALALARTGGAESREALLKLAGRPGVESHVLLDRSHAWFGLGLIRDEGSREMMEKVVQDRSLTLYERGRALEGVAFLGGERSAKALRSVMENTSESELIRVLALRCMPLLGLTDLDRQLTEINERRKTYGDLISGQAISVSRNAGDTVTRGKLFIVPAFLPYLNTRLPVVPGLTYRSLSHGLWSNLPDVTKVTDERGGGMAHLYKTRTMALVAVGGRERYHAATGGLGDMAGIQEGMIFLLPNHPPVIEGDEAEKCIPHFKVIEDAIGFMTVHLEERLP